MNTVLVNISDEFNSKIITSPTFSIILQSLKANISQKLYEFFSPVVVFELFTVLPIFIWKKQIVFTMAVLFCLLFCSCFCFVLFCFYLFIYLFIYLSIYLFIYLFIYLCMHFCMAFISLASTLYKTKNTKTESKPFQLRITYPLRKVSFIWIPPIFLHSTLITSTFNHSSVLN